MHRSEGHAFFLTNVLAIPGRFNDFYRFGQFQGICSWFLSLRLQVRIVFGKPALSPIFNLDRIIAAQTKPAPDAKSYIDAVCWIENHNQPREVINIKTGLNYFALLAMTGSVKSQFYFSTLILQMFPLFFVSIFSTHKVIFVK